MRKKLFRTMGKYRAQFISMIVMIALGIGVFVGFNMEWYSLEKDVHAFFDQTGFADYRVISETGFSAEDAAKVAAIKEVTAASRYLSVGTAVKGNDDTLALTVSENMRVSGILLIDGDAYDKTSEDGLWLSDRYARENGLHLGDRLTLIYKNLEITGTIKGLVKAGEYLICLPDATQLMPDYSSFGFVYISPVMLKNALGTEYYPQINLQTTLEKKECTEQINRALGKTMLLLSKDDTVSYAEAMGESEEGKTMGSILPVLFLAIALLTMVTTMHRLTAAEKTQIGTFKALGFRDRRITLHYACYALTVGLAGTLFGLLLGWALGWYIMNPGGAMGTYLDMDDWSLYVPPFVWVTIAAMNLFLLLIGFLSVRTMLRGTAADALRPYSPKKMRSLFIERLPFWNKLGFGTKWNLRDSLRHKSRTGMTLFGIIGCTVLLVGALGMNDTMSAFVKLFYHDTIRYEMRINLDTETITEEETAALCEQYDCDRCAKMNVQVADQSVGAEVYGISHDLVRFITGESRFVTLTDDGAYVCERIAKDNDVQAGDTLTFSPFGTDDRYTVRIAGVIRSLSESIVMTEAYADQIGFPYRTNILYTKSVEIAPSEQIINTHTKQSIIDSFDTFIELMNVMIVLLMLAAVILGIVVLYNLGVMSYTERTREMATLKVLGFKDKKIGRLLIGQNLWLTVIGVALGIPAGIGVLQYLLVALAAEYELSLAIGSITYAVSTLLTFGVSLIVGWMIARKSRKVDMVEAMKGQE